MSKKRTDKESIICLTPNLSQSSSVYRIQSDFFYSKRAFKERGKCRIEQKRNDNFLTATATVIKKNSTKSRRKHSNDLKVHEKTVRTAIKQDLNLDLNFLAYAIWSALKDKANAISHPNIG